MGWITCLPAVCLSKTSITIPRRAYYMFEERTISEEGIHSFSAVEFSGNRHKKSTEGISYFMCDLCEYNGESKSKIFEHYIKNHVFLCTLCSYAAVGRSCVLKHCLEQHEKVMKEKLKDMTIHKLNVDTLVSKMSVSFEEFLEHQELTNLSDNDLNSDEEVSESSFLGKNRSESKRKSSLFMSSEEDSEVESAKNKSIFSKRKSSPKRTVADFNDFYHGDDFEHHGVKTGESLNHFLDRTSSPGKAQHEDEDYNSFSDSDADLGESIFHDHKEMFMVSRLPFPIRQDDSPNDPMNDPGSQPETSSILQTMLQKDCKQEPVDGVCSTGAISSPKNSYEEADIPKSISPGLSLPSGEALQKQFEAVIPKSMALGCSDVGSEYSTELEERLSKTGEFLETTEKTIEDKDVVMRVNRESTQYDQEEKDSANNFLLSVSNDQGNIEKDEEGGDVQVIQSEATDMEGGKYLLLRDLLKKKLKPKDENQVRKSGSIEQQSNGKSGRIEIPSEKNLQTPISIRSALDMSLFELLSTDFPIPLHSSKPFLKGGNHLDVSVRGNSKSPSAVSFMCCNCEQSFDNKMLLDTHVDICEEDNLASSSLVDTNMRVRKVHDNPVNMEHSSFVDSKSSLVTDSFAASKMLSGFSKTHMKLTLNKKALFQSDKTISGTKNRSDISKIGPKQGMVKNQNFTALEAQLKLGNKYQDQANVSDTVDDHSVAIRRKRKVERDEDYEPESESSGSCDDDTLKARMKAKRMRKHHSPLTSKTRTKLPVSDELETGGTKISKLSSSFLSSSSSSTSSMLNISATVNDYETTRLPPIGDDYPEIELQNVEVKDELVIIERTASPVILSSCSVEEGSHDFPESKFFDPESRDGRLSQTKDKELRSASPLQAVEVRNTSLEDVGINLKGASQSLLGHLLKSRSSCLNTTFTNSSSHSFISSIGAEGIEKSNETCSTAKEHRYVLNIKKENEAILFEDSNLPKSNLDPSVQQNGAMELCRHRRPQSLTESNIDKNIFCKEIKNSCHTSRLSASMMDIPDPPTTSSNSTQLLSAELASIGSPLTPESMRSQSLARSISDHRHSFVGQELLLQMASSSVRSGGIHAPPAVVTSQSQSPYLTHSPGQPRVSAQQHSSLLRNLLTTPSTSNAK